MSDAVMVSFITAGGAFLVAIVGLVVNIVQNSRLALKQDNLHKDINSRLDASLKASKELGFAEGVASMQEKLSAQIALSVEQARVAAAEAFKPTIVVTPIPLGKETPK